MATPSRISAFLAGIILLGIALGSCNNGKELKVSAGFEPEVDQQQNLGFIFNKDLAPDSVFNRWDSTTYLEISPTVKGQFMWTSASTLTFSPAEGFSPGTEYTALATRKVLRYSKKRWGIDNAPIPFHTAPLRVTSANLFWTRNKNSGNVAVQLDMSLNYDVPLAEVLPRLKIDYNGSVIKTTGTGVGNGKAVSVSFDPVNDKDENTQLRVSLQKGLKVTGSDYVSGTDTTFSVFIPSRYQLAITDVSAQHTGNNGVITVSASQPITMNNLKSAISLEPEVPFDVALSDAGFTITSSKFNASQVYQLSIAPKLEGAFGGRMKMAYAESVSFGKLRPAITFAESKGMYLSSQGFKNVLVNIVNIPSVEVTLTKVFENNLEQFMNRDKTWDYDYDDEEREGHSWEYFETNDIGTTVYSETIETAKLPGRNEMKELHLDFEDKLKNYNGIYILRLKSKEHAWVQESRIISISDIGLIVKEEKDNVYVFANSIKTTEALSGVKVSFISTNNQQLYTATTDGEGMAVFRDISQQAPGFRVGMVTAKKDEEFNFVWFGKARIGTSRYDVGGRFPNETGLITLIYPERNLYRPGETIHVSAVVRDEQWKKQPDLPVKLKLLMPNGREFASMRKVLNEQGSCEATFSPPATANTGTWVVQVFSGNDVFLGSYDISVEDFIPDRLKVQLKTDKEAYAPGETVTANIQADNLYGTPAAGRNYECELSLSKGVFSPRKYDDYDFETKDDVQSNTDMQEGATSETGKAQEAYKLPEELKDHGLVYGDITATVFDETGRPLHRYAKFPIYTQPVFLGIKSGDRYVSTRVPVSFGIVALTKDQQLVSTESEVEVVRIQWHSVIERVAGVYRFVSRNEEHVIMKQDLRISGAGTHYSFVPRESGEYEVRVHLKGSANYVSASLYAYGWDDTQYSSFEVDNEGNVEIKTDKKEYNNGEEVKVLFTTPFEGKMLVTVEKDQLLKHYYLNTKNKSASLSFTTDAAMLPNAYITATLFRPMDGSDLPLTVAHGFAPVVVKEKKYEMHVAITAVEKSRSGTQQTIAVKAAPGAYVTVAAVDEGILQIKNFKTPDPYGYFFQKVALTVRSYDMYPWLMPEVKSRLSTTGGDGGFDGSRVNPMMARRVKNVSFWSGIKQADGNGNVKYDIDIPQFSGDIRVMAVAYKDNSFGNAEAHIKVADPIVISTALPRFLSPGDEFFMPVSLSNTTGRDANATLVVKTSGQLEAKGTATMTVTVPANKEQRVVFNMAALPVIGVSTVSVSVQALGETFSNETEISVRPPASLQKITGGGLATAGKTTNINLANNFLPQSQKGKLVVSSSPLTQFSKHIDDLVRYPFGCVEQTTSAAFPQLYYADLVKNLNMVTSKEENPASNVQHAIAKLQSMQQGDGGLSYWPEGGDESWWGSVYACHFLLEARKAGYDVNAHTIDRLVDYMRYKLYRKAVETFYYNGGDYRDIAPEAIPYSLFVLAMAGKPDQSTMNYYKAHKDILTLDGRYLLSAAYRLCGQPSQAKETLPSSFAGEIPDHAFGGDFYSYIRDLALALNVLLDTDPDNGQIGMLSRQLTDQLATERYLNTQEKAFSVLAFGKIARRANKSDATATIMADGTTIGSTKGKPFYADLKSYLGKPLSILVSGKGGMYYFWEMSGISADGSVKEEDSYLRIRRTFLDRKGNLAGTTFHQNDLVVVHLTVEAAFNGTVENVAITDMLPAGFEIENTRLNNLPAMEWIKDADQPEYTDIRDDRINFFTTVDHNRQDFYYMVRAVSPGTFRLGPAMADAMYNGAYHSYNGAGKITVLER